jgi:PII-like signaling protein
VPLYVELVRRARREGVLGATAMSCLAGFGRAGVLRGTGRQPVLRDRPVVVLVIDTPERVARFVRVLAEVAPESFAVLDEVTGGVLSAPSGAGGVTTS